MFRVLPPFGGDQRAVAEVVNGIMNGKTNNTGLVTLATGNATTTTITDERISSDSKIVVIPFSAAAFADDCPQGSWINTTGQSAPSIGTSAVIEFDTALMENGVHLEDDTKLYARDAGVYEITWSLQLANSDITEEHADVWIRVNGVDIPNSTRRYCPRQRKSATEPSHLIGFGNRFVELQADDYVEIAGAVTSTLVTLNYLAADAGVPKPATPAVVVTMKLISPLAYSNIYVSSQSKGSAVLSHYANATSNKTYAYIIVG